MYISVLTEKVIIISTVILSFIGTGAVMLWGEYFMSKIREYLRKRNGKKRI